jgi:hypothetical protein
MAEHERNPREAILNSVYADGQGNAGWMNGTGTKFRVTITIGKQSKKLLLKDIDEADEFILSATGYSRHNYRQFGDDIAALFGDGDLQGDIYVLNKNDEPIHIDGNPLILGRWLAQETDKVGASCTAKRTK